jgi:DNA-binding SARP family transcriptional activator
LVTLGHTDDATVIVNLEAAGTLAVDGDPVAARDVLRALVVELATSDLTGRIGLITGPEFAGLAGVSDTARLQCTDSSTLAAQHAERQRAVVEVLGSAGVEDTLQARSDRTAEDIWLPVIYLDDATEAETPWRPVAPWSGAVLLTTVAAPGAWTLTVPSAGVATLEPISRRLFPTRLAQEDLDRITDVLATATPAPATYDHLDVTTRPVADEITEALAALPAPPPPQEPSARANDRTSHGLRINVLGPIEIDGLPRGDIPLSKRSTELLVYLALRGKATGPELDEALWHGQRVDNQTRNSLVYRTRQRVGADNLPLVDADGHYRLGPDVICDWRTFQALARAGFAAGVDEVDHLWAALGVVRNRPFLGIDDAAYTWAERDIQQMISAIVDTAHVLSRVLLDANDDRGAAEAAAIGIGVEQCSELLYEDVIAAARAQGDLDEVSRLSARLHAVLEQLDPDYATA